MEKLSTAPLTPDHEQEERPDGLSSAGPIVAIIIATVVLSFAKDILMPLTMAALLAVIFSPIASRLDRFVGSFVSAALVVITAVTIVVAIGYFVTIELTSVAVQVSDYSDNVATKLTALKGSTPEWLQRVEDGIKDVEQQLNDLAPQSKRAKPAGIVQAPAAPSYLEQAAKPVVPILSGLFDVLLVVVLMFFLLYGRNDLRDRLVRLAARGRITLSAEAIGTAGEAVGHYLLLFAMTNLGYGIAIGLTMWTDRVTQPDSVGSAGGALSFHSLCRRSDCGSVADAGGVCSVPGMEQVGRGFRGVRHLRSNRGLFDRAFLDRPRDWLVAARSVVLRDVLGMAMGASRPAAGDFFDCVPESGR